MVEEDLLPVDIKDHSIICTAIFLQCARLLSLYLLMGRDIRHLSRLFLIFCKLLIKKIW